MLLVDSLLSLEPLLEVIKPLTNVDETRKADKQLPWFHSQTLPLIHVTADQTRIFIPVDIFFNVLLNYCIWTCFLTYSNRLIGSSTSWLIIPPANSCV